MPWIWKVHKRHLDRYNQQSNTLQCQLKHWYPCLNCIWHCWFHNQIPSSYLYVLMFSSIMAATGRHSNSFHYMRFPFFWSLFSPFFFQEYHWDNTIKANLLTSFFWGYVITQLPAGQLAQRFGPKILLTGSLFICSLFTILMPLAAEYGDWGLLCATRVVQGLAQVSHLFCTIFHVNNWIQWG